MMFDFFKKREIARQRTAAFLQFFAVQQFFAVLSGENDLEELNEKIKILNEDILEAIKIGQTAKVHNLIQERKKLKLIRNQIIYDLNSDEKN